MGAAGTTGYIYGERDCFLSCVTSESEFKVTEDLKRKNKAKISDEIKEIICTI